MYVYSKYTQKNNVCYIFSKINNFLNKWFNYNYLKINCITR